MRAQASHARRRSHRNDRRPFWENPTSGILLDEATLRHNQDAIKKQLSRFLDFDSDAPNAAEMVNNYDWMKDFTFLDFAREIGKHITVNYMMAKDSVKSRLNGTANDGLSFTEFTYQLLQGYDFLHLYKNKNCRLQMGGSDQWGNITTGAELIRRTGGGDCLRAHMPAYKPKPTAVNSGKPKKATYGSMRRARRLTNFTSSGSTPPIRMRNVT